MDANNIELKKRLISLGAKEQDIETIIKDVSKVIASKLIAEYSMKLSKKQKATLESMPESEISKFLDDNQGKLPPITKEGLERIYKITWNEYFEGMRA